MIQHVGIWAEEIAASPLLAAYLLVMGAVLGTVFGSFVNCLADRTVSGESVMRGRSHCACCGHPLGAADLVPVASYLALKGRCRYCGARLSPRYVGTELLMGALFDLGLLRYGLSLYLARYLILCGILLALSLVDADTLTIPDRFLAAALVNWALFLPLLANPLRQLVTGLTGGAAASVSMLVLSLIFDRLSGRESLGGGDVKLYGIAGLYLGPLGGYLCVMLSCLIGLAAALVLRRRRIPFAPAISGAVVICLMIGEKVVHWYVNLL